MVGKPKPIKTASPTLRQIFEMAETMNIKQVTLSDFAEVAQQHISNYKLGRHEPGIMTVERLAEAVGCKLTLTPLDDSNPGR